MRCANGTGGLRFNRKSANENERKVFQNYWKELTQLYGTFVDYFVYDYSKEKHDYFYGEQPLAPFIVPPKGLSILAEFQNDSLLLSKFGIQTEADVTFIIPIQSFYEKFGHGAEPKAGDLIRMTELGWDRPGGMDDMNIPEVAPVSACDDITSPLQQLCRDGIVDQSFTCQSDTGAYSGYNVPENFDKLLRGAPVFEITERRDENMTLQYNTLQGHYVWILHAKRFDYSYQPNAPREPGSSIPSDSSLVGLISSGHSTYPTVTGLPLPEDRKELPDNFEQNVDDDSKKTWDYKNTDNSVYGGY